MERPRYTPSANPEQAARRELKEAARGSNTVGELRRSVANRIDRLQDPEGQTTPVGPVEGGDGAVVQPVSNEQREQMIRILSGEQRKLDEAGNGYERVQLADDLPEGVNGETQLAADQGRAKVNKDLVTRPGEFKRTIRHEASKEIGHAAQGIPQVKNDKAALILDADTPLETTTVVEGFVERGTAQEIDGDPNKKRVGQPKKHYEEGQDAANGIVEEVGEEAWTEANRTGNYAALQERIWAERLRGANDLRAILEQGEQLMEEGHETGYVEESQRVVIEKVRQVAPELIGQN